MINIAICDDENYICSKIEDMIIKYKQEFYVNIEINIFNSGQEFYNKLKIGKKYDVIFLDIEMDILNGLDIGKIIREELEDEITRIIYISSYSQYALKLFKLRPTDFLIKPIKEDEFRETFNKVLKLINIECEYFEFKSGVEKYRIPLKDIVYFSTIKYSKKIKIKTVDKEYQFYGTIKELNDKLEKYRFICPYSSYLVNYKFIKNIGNKKLTLFSGKEIPLSKYKIKEIKMLKLKFIKEE